ncbi:MAG: hypothetical protein K2G18_08350 [Bacteroidales bacterium]|nr:hypothetical protein [Bacteroidales bacterium]
MGEYLVPPICGWTYLYGRNAGVSVSSRIVATLTMHLHADILSAVLQEAAVRFPQMAVGLEQRDGKLAFVPCSGPVPLFHAAETGGCAADFADAALSGYLFKVSYIHKTVYFDFHRALTDEYGMMSFAKSVLFRYLELSGCPVRNDGSVKLLSGTFFQAEGEDAMLKMEDINASRPVWYMDAKAIVPPSAEKGQEEVVQVRIPMDGPMKLFTGAAVNHVACISPAFSQAVQEMYAGSMEKGEYVVASVSVNLRPYFPAASLRPFTANVYLAYNRSLTEYPYNTVQMSQKKLLEAQMKSDALAYSVQRYMTDIENALDSSEVSGELYGAMSDLQEKTGERATYRIGGIGNVILPESMRRLVEEFYPVIPSGGKSYSLTVENYSGNLVVAVCGAERTAEVCARFVEILHENDIDAFIADTYGFVPMDMKK